MAAAPQHIRAAPLARALCVPQPPPPPRLRGPAALSLASPSRNCASSPSTSVSKATGGSSCTTSSTSPGPSKSQNSITVPKVFREALLGAGWSVGRSPVHHAVTGLRWHYQACTPQIQKLRETIVPSAKSYPLGALMDDCKNYFIENWTQGILRVHSAR
ncbi:hypothetical protein PR202_ga08160 [Eleusine coracana subsp. coracana]|uniref:Uncharacterized protein n=1 Tax=Eleusine coracana subsp. coracana TaxID=191504 RepID=A0AAV5C0I7_ELECO|nr:hypothetical protein PR202_ga08160 [Eleusine coracana subsp. coracana]